MKLYLENMMKIARGDLDIEPGKVTAVLGHNMRGKSSAALAIGAALAADVNPMGLAATATKNYVRDGQDSAAARIVDDGTEVVVWHPRAGDIAIHEGYRPCSRASVGLVKFVLLSPKERVAVWESLFLPAEAVLRERLTEALTQHLDKREIKGVLATIDAQGWDGIDRIYSDRARRAKREWTQITGLNYGVKQAADWHPADWLQSYDGISIDDAQTDLDAARQALQGLHVANAITAADKERGEQAQNLIVAATVDLDAARDHHTSVKANVDRAQGELDEHKAKGRERRSRLQAHDHAKPKESSTLTCPSCGSVLLIIDGELVEHDANAEARQLKVWQERRKELVDEADEQAALVRTAQGRVEGMQPSLLEAREAMDVASRALAVIEADIALLDRPVEADNAQAIFEQETAIEQARIRLEKITARKEAADKHEAVVAYTLIAKLLGPTGVRAKAMETAMAKLDQFLGIVAQQTGWPRVKISKEYALSIGERGILAMCSESEQWRAQVTLQIAISRMKRDPVIVIDRADILDEDARGELQSLLKTLLGRDGAPAIVVMATELSDEPAWLDGLDATAYRIDANNIIAPVGAS